MSESCSVLSDSLQPHGLFSPWNFTEQNTGVGSLSLLQGIFPTQGSTQVSRTVGRHFHYLSHQGLSEPSSHCLAKGGWMLSPLPVTSALEDDTEGQLRLSLRAHHLSLLGATLGTSYQLPCPLPRTADQGPGKAPPASLFWALTPSPLVLISAGLPRVIPLWR